MFNLKTGLTAGLTALGVYAANIIGAFADDTTTIGALSDDTTTIGASEPAAATAEAAASQGTTGWLGQIPTWVIILIYVAILGAMFYFLIIRPQRKRRKEEEEMKNSICLGQEVVTIGGIVGKIVNIKDDNITLQSSIDNTLVEVKNWAIREYKKEEKAEEKK